MQEQLRDWIEATTAGRVVEVARPAIGGSREQYFVEVMTRAGERRSLVLRCEAGSSFSGTELCPAKEAGIYRALEGSEVPVPRVVGLAPQGAALLMERLPGTSDLSGLAPGEREATLLDLVDAVAALHRLDAETLELPGLPVPRTPADHARLDLQLWERLADAHVEALDPLLVYAGAWLYTHPPRQVARTVLVQGDTGPGNFVCEGGRVTGLVDWEMAHIGDPMDDLAWLDLRNGDELRERLHARYQQRSGIPIDEQSIRYYALAVRYRCGIITSMAIGRGGGARGLPAYLLAQQRYLLEVDARLAQQAGISEPPVDLPPGAETARTPWYDLLRDTVRSAARGLEDPAVREPTRDSQILIHYLRAYDRVGAELAEQDRADCRATLGLEPDSDALAQAARQAGERTDATVLRYLLRRRRRGAHLWSSLLSRSRSR